MIADLLLYETGGGGDLFLRGSDLVTVTGYETAVYLAMFGGDTWWGNKTLPEEKQFKAQTEKALRTNPLTSAGRTRIEEAVNADMAFLRNIPDTKWSTSVTIQGPDRLSIEITINGKTFSYVWNPDKMYLTYQI